MNKISAAVVTAVSLLAPYSGPAGTSEPRLSIVRVAVDGPTEAAYVAEAFDETHVSDPGYVHVLLWPGDAAELDLLGYDYEVVVEDVVERDRRALVEARSRGAGPVALPGPDRSDYRVLDDYVSEMQALAEDHPSLVSLLELPHPTHEGRTVYGVEIASDVRARDGRPTFYVDGIHHAREWPAGEYPMIFAHYLVEGFRKNQRVTKLLERGRVVVVPVVNPDGFDFSRSSPLGAHRTVDGVHGQACGPQHCEAYWRNNRRSYLGQTLPGAQRNPDAYGVDPNRNYSFLWGGAGSTNSILPIGDQTYRGAAPHSEPETQNVQDLILSKNVTSIVSNHTYSRLVLRPWGDRMEDAPDEKYLASLGARMAKAMGGYQNIKGIQLYPTTGTMSEWGYGTLHVPSYTFEHGTAFHPPYAGCSSDCVEAGWRGVMQAFLLGAEAALDSRRHAVVSGEVVGADGAPAKAELTITRRIENPLSSGNPLGKAHHSSTFRVSIDARGSFRWHLPPSVAPPRPGMEKRTDRTYQLTVRVPGAKTPRTFKFVLDAGGKVDLGKIRP